MYLKVLMWTADHFEEDGRCIKACFVMHNETNLMAVNTRLRTFLLITLTFALAVAPLRGALAIATPATADTEPDCAEMTHAMPSADSTTIHHHDSAQTGKTDDCCQDCDGTCGDSNCVDCVNASTAILNTDSLLPEYHSTTQTLPVVVSFPPGNFSPPFRPPVSL